MMLTYPRVLAVGDRAVTVELGASLDEETVGRVRALDERVQERSLSGVLESVPTYAALLVIYDRHRISVPELSETLLLLARGVKAVVGTGRLVCVPALYDGEDLDEVAKDRGLTRDDVVALHSARDYSVLMLGFSPGFAYMGFVDERLNMPRRKTPRTRVPAGSIGLTGVQTGIYPRILPGGWNLLGRTSLRLFDASVTTDDATRGPSLLMPGDRVRFVATTSLEPSSPLSQTKYVGSGVRVSEPGILTTIQDAGRPGLRRVAVPLTGYADPQAARLANACVGNRLDAPLIELCGPGLQLFFERTTFVAITGARVAAELERGDLEKGRMPMPQNVAVRVRASNVLTIVGLEDAVRGYVAIAGLEAPLVLGSSSADRSSGFMRPLESGDSFNVNPPDSDRARREPIPLVTRPDVVRIILGPQIHHFDERGIAAFFETSWQVGLDSDRVGARLDGPKIPHAGPAEIVSDGMVPGCIQIPPDGRPIVMLADCPTTGGYPKIGCVVSDDLGIMAQAIPGRSKIRFMVVRIEDL